MRPRLLNKSAKLSDYITESIFQVAPLISNNAALPTHPCVVACSRMCG